jgi:uncharacterized protein (DUF433 family)
MRPNTYLAGNDVAKIPYTVLPERAAISDVREFPLYSLAEISYFFRIPKTTLHAWTRPSKMSGKPIRPLIELADRENALFSFYNLAEAHILSMTTRFHGVKTSAVRRAMEHLREESIHDLPHPLLSDKFLTDGRHIWIRELEKRIDLTQFGQLGLAPILDTYLERIIRDDSNRPLKVFPIRQTGKVVSITPTVSSGRPIVEGTGIPVATLYNRFKAGDSADDLAEDYEISEDQVKGAIDYIEQLATAA